jgi:hypothetical protein
MKATKPGFPVLAAFVLSLAAPTANATPFADSVVSFAGGSGSGVYDSAGGGCTGATGEGTFDASAIVALDGCGIALGGATGTPGEIVLRFTSGSVVDGAGNDIVFYDTFGLHEGLAVEASADGTTFVSLAAVGGAFPLPCSLATPCTVEFDLAGSGLSSASYFRATAVPGDCVFAFPECFDLDAAEALNFAAAPEPGSLALIAAGFVGGFAIRRRRR